MDYENESNPKAQAPPKVKLTGRPDRNEPINKDDVTNLKITLRISKSIDAFLKAGI